MAGVNVIGGTLADVKKLLNELAYGDDSTPGMRESNERWKQAMVKSNSILTERFAKRRKQ